MRQLISRSEREHVDRGMAGRHCGMGKVLALWIPRSSNAKKEISAKCGFRYDERFRLFIVHKHRIRSGLAQLILLSQDLLTRTDLSAG